MQWHSAPCEQQRRDGSRGERRQWRKASERGIVQWTTPLFAHIARRHSVCTLFILCRAGRYLSSRCVCAFVYASGGRKQEAKREAPQLLQSRHRPGRDTRSTSNWTSSTQALFPAAVSAYGISLVCQAKQRPMKEGECEKAGDVSRPPLLSFSLSLSLSLDLLLQSRLWRLSSWSLRLPLRITICIPVLRGRRVAPLCCLPLRFFSVLLRSVSIFPSPLFVCVRVYMCVCVCVRVCVRVCAACIQSLAFLRLRHRTSLLLLLLRPSSVLPLPVLFSLCLSPHQRRP